MSLFALATPRHPCILYNGIHRRTLPSLPQGLSRAERGRAGALNLAFLDGPGGSQVPQAVIDAIGDFYATCNVNTHGNFWPSQEVDRRMDRAREVAAALSWAPRPASCISFGQNMTTLNYALSAAIGRTLQPGDEVLITQLDHEANRGPWLRLAERGMIVQEVRLLPSGLSGRGRHGGQDHAAHQSICAGRLIQCSRHGQ